MILLPPEGQEQKKKLSPAKQKIHDALVAHGYTPGKIEWSPVQGRGDDFTGGFCVDNFGAFGSATDFIAWLDHHPSLHIKCIAECRDDAFDYLDAHPEHAEWTSADCGHVA